MKKSSFLMVLVVILCILAFTFSWAADEKTDEDKDAGKIVTVKEVEKSLIKPTNKFFSDWRSGEVRGTVFYTNSYKKKVEEISIKFMICDGDGKPLRTWKQDVGTLDPGAKTKEFAYYYINPSRFNINNSSFKYEFTYRKPKKDKPKTEEKDKKKKKGK